MQNYGAKFDLIQTGIPGPVEIIGRKGDERIIKDLSSHKWRYKVNLNGIEKKLYSGNSKSSKWLSEDLPLNKRMTWYKVKHLLPKYIFVY